MDRRLTLIYTLLASRIALHASASFVEPEVHQVVVLHDILLEFQALLAGALGLGLAAGFDEIGEADDLRANEALLDVRMDGARRFPGGRAFANRPGAVLLAADGEERDVAGVREGAQEQRLGVLQFLARRDGDRLVGVKAVRRDRLQVLAGSGPS